MSAHTPGPWVHSFENADPEWAIVTTTGGNVLANVNADARQGANARLIAAAPELLEALKACAAVCAGEVFGKSALIAALEAARAAIAKAEGR